MRILLRSVLLVGLSVSLSGCTLILMLALFAEVPTPISTLDILWADNLEQCAALKVGAGTDEDFIDGPDRHYAAASTMDRRSNAEVEWRRQAAWPSFLVLSGTMERGPSSTNQGVREDAARAYFDVNQDGQRDLVYEIHGPPSYRNAFVIFAADETVRAWFERQLGSLKRDWRRQVEARGGHVLEIADTELLHSDGVTYLLCDEGAVAFDPFLRSPPLTLGTPEDDARATTSASIIGAYRITWNFTEQRACTFRSQWMGVLVGGF